MKFIGRQAELAKLNAEDEILKDRRCRTDSDK